MRTLPLSVTASVTLNGSGNGTASIGPYATNETWQVNTVSVSVATNVNEAIAKVYAGPGVSQSTFQDGTTWGSTGDSTSNVVVPVHVGEAVYAVWTGGDSGARSTVVVTGTRSVP